ncbi:MAG: CoA transferase [Betaproteobacteria bacterium]|nr:MAG: CoA transferase [Betaproteobacteria bacterium]
MHGDFADGPLTGIKVLDLTNVVMGPYATHILADMGADVIKIESADSDFMRNYRPYRHRGMSGQVLQLHRNKRSLVLDLKRTKCAAALQRLIAKCDVLVHSMRPKAIKRLGFDYDRVREINRDIVYCGAYGFGKGGPYEDKAAYDDMIQASCGIVELNQRVRGEPTYVPTAMCDKLTGQTIAYAILGALVQRARGGGGQQVEVPMFETCIEFMLTEHICGASFEPPLGKVGYARLLNRARRPYRTADGYACIMPYSDRNWRDFFDYIGKPELKGDGRFATFDDRVREVEVLYGLIAQEAGKHTTAEWLAFCDNASIACMPVISLDEIHEDPHVRAVGLIEVQDHPTEGRIRVLRSPVKFGAAPFKVRRPAPTLGQDSAEVLAEFGFSGEEIDGVLGPNAGSDQ